MSLTCVCVCVCVCVCLCVFRGLTDTGQTKSAGFGLENAGPLWAQQGLSLGSTDSILTHTHTPTRTHTQRGYSNVEFLVLQKMKVFYCWPKTVLFELGGVFLEWLSGYDWSAAGCFITIIVFFFCSCDDQTDRQPSPFLLWSPPPFFSATLLGTGFWGRNPFFAARYQTVCTTWDFLRVNIVIAWALNFIVFPFVFSCPC